MSDVLGKLFSPLTGGSRNKTAASDEEATMASAETDPLVNTDNAPKKQSKVNFSITDKGSAGYRDDDLDTTQPRETNPSDDHATPPRGYGTLRSGSNLTSESDVSNLPPVYATDGPGLFPETDDTMVGSPDSVHDDHDVPGAAADAFQHLSLNRAHSLLRMQHLSVADGGADGNGGGGGGGGGAQRTRPTLRKTQSSFWEDARNFTEGTIPQSIVIALCVGTVCGVAAFIYYSVLFYLLETIWHTLPEMWVVDRWGEEAYVAWIPIVGFSMAILTGLTVVLLGEPGDLACKCEFLCMLHTE